MAGDSKLFSSSEMFSIYNYSKDPMMLVKSERYTGGEWKKVVELVDLEQNLLVSSQISNALLSIQQQKKIMQEKLEEAKDA